MLIEVIKKDGNKGFIETSVQPDWKKNYDEYDGIWIEKKKEDVVFTVPKQFEATLDELHVKYKEKTGNDVPNRYKNNPEWIVSKL